MKKSFNLLYEDINNSITVYHISNTRFTKFDLKYTPQGIIWFAKDKQSLIEDLHGAAINNKLPIYLYTCLVTPKKIANWNQYDKYSIGELQHVGYDSIDLDEDFAVINPKIIQTTQVSKIN